MIKEIISSYVALQKFLNRLQIFLGVEGTSVFQQYVIEHGTVSPVYMNGGIPHPVHFREGMVIRNFMRKYDFFKDFGHDDLDDHWTTVIEMILDDMEEVAREATSKESK